MKKTGCYRWTVLAPLRVKQFGFTPKELGWILSTFGFGCCAMQCRGSAAIVRWQQSRRIISGMGTLWAGFIGLVAVAGSGPATGEWPATC